MKNNLIQRIQKAINDINNLISANREIKEVESWDGSASNYADTAEYCSACLIDVNPDGQDKVQSLCMLPVRGPGDGAGVYVDKAVMAAAGGRGITQVEKPDSVDQDTWDAAVKSAANKLITAYDQMDRQAPDSVYELAGKTPPESGSDTSQEDDEDQEMSRALSTSQMADQLWRHFYKMEGESGCYYWINDVYFDDTGKPFVIVSEGGRLYRAELQIDGQQVMVGDLMEVKIEFEPTASQPAEEMRTKTTIIRQADGLYRWFGVSCSSVLNRVGSFDTRALFDSFVERFYENPDKEVIRQFYHQGDGYRTGVVDFVARDGNLLITSGIYDDTPLARAEIEARQKEPGYWGDSIGFLGEEPQMVRAADGIEIPAYTNGILREVSTLPEVDAASHFTVQTVQEVSRMLEGKALEAFIKLWGDEDAATQWLADNPEKLNRAIEDAGLQTRSSDQAESPDPEAATQTPEPAQGQAQDQDTEFVIGEDEIGAIADAVLETEAVRTTMAQATQKADEALETLSGQVGQLLARLEALEKTEEQKRAEWLADLPQARKVSVTYRPREAAAQQTQEGDQARNAEDKQERVKETLAKLPPYPFLNQ